MPIYELRVYLPDSKLPDPSVNPGNAFNCPRFKTWKHANTYFARYAAFGDVSHLDVGSGLVGIPCESLPGSPTKR